MDGSDLDISAFVVVSAKRGRPHDFWTWRFGLSRSWAKAWLDVFSPSA
jgi:hypothetical protein